MKRLIIECGAAQTRAALLDGDEVWKFWFGPARGDEAGNGFPAAGRRFAARVRHVDRGLGAAFLDLGPDALNGRDAFLPLKKSSEAHCIEGAMLEVAVKSPPRQGKGALLKFIAPASGAEPGRLPPFADAAVEAAAAIGANADEMVIDDGAAFRALEQAGFGNQVHENHPLSLFERYGAQSELSAAFERAVALPGGGRLVIDEAQALTAVDVDTGGLGASSPARLREKIAIAAAGEAVRQISLRNIGGHIVIDFPDISNEASRKRFGEHLRAAMTRLPGAGAPSFSKSGLFCFTAPHSALSLLDRFTEPCGAGPVPGRRFTVEAKALEAVAALERGLRAAPSARYRLVTGAEIERYLAARPHWRERLAGRYGARFQIVCDKQRGGREHDLTEQ